MTPTPPPAPVVPGAALAPGTSRRDAWSRVRSPLLLGGAVAAATLALHLRDPHTPGSWGECPWLLLTGWYCPGCGGLRAVNDLTRGDLGAALSSNLLVVVLLPVVVLGWVGWTRRAWRGRPAPRLARSTAVVAVAVAVVVVITFTVLRNTPTGAWLAP